MSPTQSPDRQVAESLVEELQSLLADDLVRWLMEDRGRRDRATRLVKLIKRDTAGELKIRPLDLLRDDHPALSMITSLARKYLHDEQMSDPHLTQCSVCAAFVESEAARYVIRRGFRTDASGNLHKVPEAATDNDQWFGGVLDHGREQIARKHETNASYPLPAPDSTTGAGSTFCFGRKGGRD